ncbi:MAG: leucine-rich repeat protein [Clostridiales Family XIII bacterium]|nr:leucine-rich repeat protein [Clostridiales Family XIII bacterium]
MTGPNSYTGVLTVPATITINGGNIGGGTVSSANYGTYPVTEIGYQAFYYGGRITGVSLSDATNLRIIREGAFHNCYNLGGILKIPPSLETIEDRAFNDTSIKELDLSNASKLTSIGINAFLACIYLTGTITLPENLTTIGKGAFAYDIMSGIDFSRANKLTYVGPDMFFYKDGASPIVQITFGSSIPTNSFQNDTFRYIRNNGVVFYPWDTGDPTPYQNFVATYLTSQGVSGWTVFMELDVGANSIPESIVGEEIEEVDIVASLHGGTQPLVSYTLAGGSLPLGLTLSPEGKVSGTPTQITPAGEITVIVTDSGAGNFNQSKSIVVPYGEVKALGSDATLVSYELGGVSGSTAEALGTPAATYNDVAISAGAVTLTGAQAKNANFIATPTDETATLQYAYTATDTEPSFGTWTPRTIANDGYVWVKVTAEDGNTLIYKIKVTVTKSGGGDPAVDHHIIKHSHDKNYKGKDGLTAFGDDVVVEFAGELKGDDGVTTFVFNEKEYKLSDVDSETSIAITDLTGANAGSITNGKVGTQFATLAEQNESIVLTLPADFADRLENGTHEMQVWFADSTTGDKSTAGVATIVVSRKGEVKPLPIPPLYGGDTPRSGATPKTGDGTNILLMLALAGLAVATLLSMRAKRSNQGNRKFKEDYSMLNKFTAQTVGRTQSARTSASIFISIILCLSLLITFIPKLTSSSFADDSGIETLPNPLVVAGSPAADGKGYTDAVDYPDDGSKPHPAGPNLGDSTIVNFAGHEWIVIGWDGNGVAAAADTATLLLSNATEESIFSDKSSEYNESTLQTSINSFYTAFPEKEKATTIVKPRTLSGDSGNSRIVESTGALGNTNSLSSVRVGEGSNDKYVDQHTGVSENATFDWYAYDVYRKANGYNGTFNPDNVAGVGNVANQALWPLSLAEASLLDPSIRANANYWWLRSPGVSGTYVASVRSTGRVDSTSPIINSSNIYVRPAFNLNLESVVLTSAVTGGKSALGDGLTLTETPSGKLKFTFKDDTNLHLAVSAASRIVKSGETVNIDYTVAETGPDRYVSAVIVDKIGNTIFYGKLVDLSSAGSKGTATFTVPTALGEDDYTLRIFNEEIGGDTFSDFASTPVDIPMTVNNSPDTTAPTLTAGAVSRTSDAEATVKFSSDEAGTRYYQIDGDVPTATALAEDETNKDNMILGENTINLNNLTPGAHTIYIAGDDENRNVSNLLTIAIPAFGAQSEKPDHHIIFHSHDSAYGGKDGLTAFGEDVVVEFKGDFDTVQSFNFNDEGYNLSAYKDDKTPRTITEEDGNVIGSITQGSAVVTLSSSFADRLENGTHELQVWFDDSIVGDDTTAGIAEIVVQRDGGVVPVGGGTKTGDEASLNLFLTIGGISLLMLIALIVYRRKVLA